MCSPPWPSSTWLLRQRQVVGHYHCWHHLASCCKGENGRHNRSPAVTNSPSLSQWKAMMDKPPQAGLSASLHSTMAPRGTCSERTLRGLALFGWAGLSSTPFYSAVVITWTCILPRERGTKWRCFCCSAWSHVPSNDCVVYNSELVTLTQLWAPPPLSNCEKTTAMYQQKTRHRDGR